MLRRLLRIRGLCVRATHVCTRRKRGTLVRTRRRVLALTNGKSDVAEQKVIFRWPLVPSPARKDGSHHGSLRAASNTPAKPRLGPRTCPVRACAPRARGRLPTFLDDQALGPSVSATALALVGRARLSRSRTLLQKSLSLIRWVGATL